jgi:hypothetical protein
MDRFEADHRQMPSLSRSRRRGKPGKDRQNPVFLDSINAITA